MTMKKEFSVTGMTCAACSAHVEKAVKKLGVQSVEVSLLSNRMTVDSDLSDDTIIAAVKNAGYGASVMEDGRNGGGRSDVRAIPDDLSKTLLIRFLLSVIFLVPLMYFSMGHMVGLPMGALDPHVDPASFALIQAVLTAPVLVINGRFFVGGIRSVLHRSPNMDTLVSIGSGASYIYGLIVLFMINTSVANGGVHYGAELTGNLFFESAAMILTLVTLGKFLEAKSKGKTRSEVDKLLRLRPQTATVVRDGKPISVPIEQISVGDTVIVLPGEYIPCDGVITDGATTLDKSAITGESLPVETAVGDMATSAVLNLTGRVEMRAEKVGSDSTLSKIIELIEHAGGSKAPIQKIADKVSAVFVPTVCAISLVTLIVWLAAGSVGQALTMAISVLVISCPCALGLATPVAVMAGTGRAAAYGVLVKNAEVLQGLESVGIFALDKTATITEGKPRVVSVTGYGGFSGNESAVIGIAAALEKTSTHPLAYAILQAAENDATAAENSVYKIGYGVVGTVDGVEYALGNVGLLKQFGAEPTEEERPQTVYLCKRGELLGAITVDDNIRESSKRVVAELKSTGAQVVMLTGDGKAQAERIAAEVGIDEVYSEVLPKDKLDIVESLKSRGKTAMVGDGINDAPALKAADIGIAIGSGTDVAIEAADVVLVKSDLGDVPRAVAVSHASLRNVKQNLFWAFIYNIIGIPLAAGALYAWDIALNPMIAAAAMAFSSLFVVCNALRLTVMKFDDKHVERKLRKIRHKKDRRADGCGANSCGIEIGEIKMKQTLKIDGMMCMHCVGRVESALKAVKGVTGVDVSLDGGTAELEGSFDVKEAVAAVKGAGYECREI